MPFGLKKMGATNLTMVDRMFRTQLGHNMEVYVDDMLVKSKLTQTHADDLQETMATMRKYGMQLNPHKCAFGVRAGKFLGYIVTEKGIEVNPAKVRAIIELAPPKNLKEAQVFAGKVVVLSRFISRLADRSLLFFKVLRKGDNFDWTESC